MAKGISIRAVTFDRSRYRQLVELFGPDRTRALLRRAIVATTRKALRVATKYVQDKLEIPRKYISGTNRHAALNTRIFDGEDGMPVGVLIVKQKLLPLIAFKARGSKRNGVTVKISKDMPPLRLKHAFITRVASQSQLDMGVSHRGVFTRSKHLPTKGPNMGKGKLTPQGFAGRFAIEEKFGPSILDLLSKEQIARAMTKDVEAVLMKEVDSQVSRITRGEFKSLKFAYESGLRYGNRARFRP